MQIEGALIKEQGITFAVVIVKPHLLNDSSEREKQRGQLSSMFGHVPTVLMAQDSSGRPTYHGRHDIVKFLANVSISSIPWKRYNY